MRRTVTILLVILVSLLGAHPLAAHYGDRLLRLADGVSLGLGQVLHDLKRAHIVFVGEKHDEAAHHDLQLRVIRALSGLTSSLAVGLEMFPEEDQDILDGWVRGEVDEGRMAEAHRDNWGPTWSLYRDIYRFARIKNIPLVGLNVPRGITEQVAREGFASLGGEQLARMPTIACDVDEEYRSFMRNVLQAHGVSMEGRKFEHFCEAQLVWDKVMAWRARDYLRNNEGSTLVLLAGGSHAWKPGIPTQVARLDAAIDMRVILPELPGIQSRRNAGSDLADYLWLTETDIHP